MRTRRDGGGNGILRLFVGVRCAADRVPRPARAKIHGERGGIPERFAVFRRSRGSKSAAVELDKVIPRHYVVPPSMVIPCNALPSSLAPTLPGESDATPPDTVKSP